MTSAGMPSGPLLGTVIVSSEFPESVTVSCAFHEQPVMCPAYPAHPPKTKEPGCRAIRYDNPVLTSNPYIYI